MPQQQAPINKPEEQTTVAQLPLVSCIMPTAGRPAQVAKSVELFLKQDYPVKELIIVYRSDSDLPPLPNHPSIRLVFFPGKTIGAKRNEACRQARGAIIAHWDDDDIYGANRLWRQAEPILKGEAHITGLDNFVFYDALSGRCLRPSDSLFNELYFGGVHGGSLVYDRRIWQQVANYPNTSLGEDAAFLGSALKRGATLKAVNGAALFMYVRHGGNTWDLGRYTDSRWRQVEMPKWACSHFPGQSTDTEPQCAEIEMFGRYGITNRQWRLHRNVLDSHTSFYKDQRHRFVAVLSRPAERKAKVSGAALPLVSCVMPTAGRPQYVAKAIGYFARQDYPNKELVIVYNSDADLPKMRFPDNVRLVRSRTKILGGKRNEGNVHARGAIIAQWDDDDIYHGQRLTKQVAPLLAGTADITGLRDFVFYEMATGNSYLPTEVLFNNAFQCEVAGGALVYNRYVWEQWSHYPNYTTAEDYHFLQRVLKKGAMLQPMAGYGLFVYMRHHVNTWKFEEDNFRRYSGWQPVEAPAWAEPYLVNYKRVNNQIEDYA